MQPEAVVDALVQNTAQFGVALQNQNILHARMPCGKRCGKPGRTAAQNHEICVFHLGHPPFYRLSLSMPAIMRDAPPDFVMFSIDSPNSRAKISITRGLQKPD